MEVITMSDEIPDLTDTNGVTDVSEFFDGDELNDIFETLSEEDMIRLIDELNQEHGDSDDS